MFLLPEQWKRPSKKLFDKSLRLRRTTLSRIIKGRIPRIQRKVTVDHRKSHLKILRKLNLKVVKPKKLKTILMITGITRIMKSRDHQGDVITVVESII